MYNKKNTKKFDNDLDWGKYWEWETISFVESYFNEGLNPKGMRIDFNIDNQSRGTSGMKEWDMKYCISDIETKEVIKYITFEIKADKYDNTGNVLFERTCSKKDSGIMATKADYFIYIMPRHLKNNFYICKSEYLREILLKDFSSCISMGNGDGGRVTSFLINKNIFDEKFLENSKCKILTCDLPIPDRFNISKFNELKKYSVIGDNLDFLKSGDDIFDF